MTHISRRLASLETLWPEPAATEPPAFDMSRWTDDELEEVAALSEKLRAVMDAEPHLSGDAVISRALTAEEMERAADLVGIATGNEPAQPTPTRWLDGWAP